MNALAGLPAPAAAPDTAAPDTTAAGSAGAPAAGDGSTGTTAGPLEALIAAIVAATGGTTDAVAAPTTEAGTIAAADVPADDTDLPDATGVDPAAPAGAMPAAALVAALLGGAQVVAAASATATAPAIAATSTSSSGETLISAPDAPAASVSGGAPAAAPAATPISAPDVPAAPVPGGPEAAPAVVATPVAASGVPAEPVSGGPTDGPATPAPPAPGTPVPTVPVPGRHLVNATPGAAAATPDDAVADDPIAASEPEATAVTTTTADTDADPATAPTTRPVAAFGPDPVLRHADPTAVPRPDVAPVAAARTAAAAPAHLVELPVSDPNVARLGGLVRTMAHGEVRSATLTLTPADLGEVRVELRSQDGVVSVHLSASHPEGLEALRNSTGTLRRELERAGLGLDRVDVGFSGDSSGHSAGHGADERAATDVDPGPTQPVRPFTSATRLARPTRPIPVRGESGLDLDL